MRRILRKIAEGEADKLGDTSTLADPSIVEVADTQRGIKRENTEHWYRCCAGLVPHRPSLSSRSWTSNTEREGAFSETYSPSPLPLLRFGGRLPLLPLRMGNSTQIHPNVLHLGSFRDERGGARYDTRPRCPYPALSEWVLRNTARLILCSGWRFMLGCRAKLSFSCPDLDFFFGAKHVMRSGSPASPPPTRRWAVAGATIPT